MYACALRQEFEYSLTRGVVEGSSNAKLSMQILYVKRYGGGYKLAVLQLMMFDTR